MNYGQNIMSSQDWYNNLSSAEKKKIYALEKEETRIERAQERLDKSWENEKAKRKRMGDQYPVESMFDDYFATQWNQEAQELQERRENNLEKWNKFF